MVGSSPVMPGPRGHRKFHWKHIIQKKETQMDQSHAAGLYYVADELSDYLVNALAAARAYRDRCLAADQPDDETYLAAQKKIIVENMHYVNNALYLLD
jgi:hypothetical protein